ncbi:M23 family metallopeptidase [Paenibacillus alkalitolerans]|uniref:M23 family metallopeptidase n=1 Tax=Paenibacillus alkalitolerans TaxID=2799335 RepID=UPI0018F603E3|nr:M23 family metallopeptidase [Paenibacillus alkalitolerans]
MLPHWKEKKLTLVVIPEANSQVRQFRLPVLWMYLIPAALLILVAITAALALLQGVMLNTNGQLKAKWDIDRESMEKLVAAKDQEIQQLQSEFVKLLAEADQMRSKVEDLQGLEQELLSITESGGPANKPGNKAVPVAVNAKASLTQETESVGGELYPIESEDLLARSQETRVEMQTLGGETERLQAALHEAKKDAERLAYIRSITPSIFPTESKRITSMFGYRKDPFTRRSAYHRGIDFSGDVNDPVYATAAGKVSRTGYDRAMGNFVFVNHGNGLETVYMHLNKVLVDHGQRVAKGEKIGLLGSTGRSTGPHLHYEVHKHGAAINPKPYLQPGRKDDA